MMKNALAAATALSLALLAAPASAADDGQLPLYPHGTPAHGMEDMPAAALARGVPYQQTTHDSVQTVDRWYRSNAPKSCSRITASGAVQYKCSGGSIVIQDRGGTIISFVPPIP